MSRRVLGVALFGAATALAGLAAAGEAGFRPGTYATQLGGETWSIQFTAKGKFRVFREDQEMVQGSYKATKNEIEVKDEKGKLASKGDQAVGRYRWKLDGDRLTFTAVRDESPGRRKALTFGPWKLRKK
jgi:hypothetical protein